MSFKIGSHKLRLMVGMLDNVDIPRTLTTTVPKLRSFLNDGAAPIVFYPRFRFPSSEELECDERFDHIILCMVTYTTSAGPSKHLDATIIA